MRFTRLLSVVVLALTLCMGSWAVDALEGAKIKMESGEQYSRNVPLHLEYAGAAPTGRIAVMHGKTGKSFPATLRDGVLTFVPEGSMPNKLQDYVVTVDTKTTDYTPKVNLVKQEDKDIIDVYIDDVHFTSYHFSDEWKKPFLWPVIAEGGFHVTRDYPVDPEGTPEEARDHIHHKSIWSAYGEVNDVDCWGEGDGSGYQTVLDVTFGSGDAYGWIKSKNVWQDKDNKDIISEEREYRFYATPEKGRLIDVNVVFTANKGDVTFVDTKEGGLVAVRMSHLMTKRAAEITNSHGDTGEPKCWGKPSPWCDYSADIEGFGYRGITVFDNPGNLRYPTSWHVRGYGLMGANAFGYSYFGEKPHNKGLVPENGDYKFKKDEVLSFNYRVYVHSGDVEEAKVADRFADYATPPKVSFVE